MTNDAPPEMKYMVRLSDGREFGPAAIPAITEWAREGRIPIDALLVDIPGGRSRPVTTDPAIAAILRPAAPPTTPGALSMPPNRPAGDDTVATMIPYRNPAALTSYYLGLFSLLPMVGLLLAIPALILGLKGRARAKSNPECKGIVHAWIGILCGGFFTLIWGGLIGLAMFA